MKKIIRIFIVLVLIVATFAACDRPSEQEIKSETLNTIDSEEAIQESETSETGIIGDKENIGEKIVYGNGRFGYSVEYPK
ncbi:hypothetical protein [Clostridium sp. DL1XJH146]